MTHYSYVHNVHDTFQVIARTYTCVACGLFVNTLYKPHNPSTMLYDGNAASALKTGRCMGMGSRPNRGGGVTVHNQTVR